MGKEFKPDQIFGVIKNSKKKWVITANALKLTVETLPINWYGDLIGEIKLLEKK